MAPRKSKTGRKLRGAQKWIMSEIEALRAGESLTTAQIAKRIKKASGKNFHKNSVYLALRKLVSRGNLDAVRQGQEKTYKAGRAGSSAPMARAPAAPTPTVVEETEGTAIVATTTVAGSESAVPRLPHKLSLGEILVLEFSDGQVLTATNLHGKLVMERHPAP